MASRDPDRILNFLTDLHWLLETVVVDEGLRAELLPEGLHQEFKNAWAEVKEGPLPQAEDAVREGQLERPLSDLGLVGDQLELKINGFQAALNRFRDALASTAIDRVSRIRRWFFSPLRWANILLGSLVAAIPVLEPVKELKEAVEAAAADKVREELHNS